MTRPLRVGIAGLGTVGASVIRILDRQDEAVAKRGGAAGRGHGGLGPRPEQGPRHRSLRLRVVRRPGGAGALGRGRLRRRADRRRGRCRAGHGARPRSLRASTSSPPTRRCSPSMAWTRASSPRTKGVVARLRGLRRRRHPDHQDPARGACRQPISRLYGILNGTCNYILSRMELEGLTFAECLADAQRLGYAEADPTFDVGGLRHRPQARHPDEPRLRHRDRRRGDLCRGHLRRSRRSTSQMATELGYPHQAARRRRAHRAGIEQRVHPTMVPNLRHRPGDGRDQRGHDRCRRGQRADPGRARGRGRCDGLRRAWPTSPTSPRGIRAALRSAARGALDKAQRAPMQRHEGGYYVRLIGARPSRRRRRRSPRAWPSADISLESIVQRRDRGDEGSARPVRRACAGRPDHLCDDRGRDPRGAGSNRWRMAILPSRRRSFASSASNFTHGEATRRGRQ